MTATLQPESKSPTRRALLAGALGGIGALAATVIGRASPVRATDGQAVIQGATNSGSTMTTVLSTTTGPALQGFSDQTSGWTVGVLGRADGTSSSAGVWGVTVTSGDVAGVRGLSPQTTGVQGYSGPGTTPPTAKAKTGVHGYANQDIFSSGVIGQSPLGVGVRGQTTSGYAGYFEGRVYTNAFYELGEVATPAAPLANRARLFVRDNGAGKTQLCVRFRTGGVHIIKTEL